jgi:hypothetical protein
MEQCVDECAVGVARAGVNHHASRLIHHNNILVLIENLERKRFRLRAERWDIGGRDGNCIAGAKYEGGARGSRVYLHAILLDPRLQA